VERTELLKCLLLYFELHLHGFQKPRSLEVLQAVFD
jgi:DNA repair protein RecO (recombination protein O)